VKAPNLYCNQELMAMATNLSYSLLVWRGWTARNSPFPFISHVAFPLSLSPLFFSPPVLLFLSLLPFLLLLFSSSTAPHTQLETHIQKQKKERKNKTKKKKKPPTQNRK
jgi:hypothetical protein